MKFKETLASIFMFSLLILQVYDFTLDTLDAFNISVELPLVLDKLSIIATIFLSFFIFQEFLEIEFQLRPLTIYVLLSIFFLSNVNIMLKFILPESFLIAHMAIFNMLPLILMFIVLPIFSYYSERSVKKILMLILFAIGIVYPVSQLYPLIMDKFVALAATIYIFYSIIKSSSIRGINFKELFQRALDFDNVVAEEVLIKPASKTNKLAFYLYAVLLFYILSDFNLYIIPSTLGLWDSSDYLAQLGLTLSKVSLPVVGYISLAAYIYFILYPLLLRVLQEQLDIVKPTILEITAMTVFFLFPSVMLSPLVSYNGYGVVMIPWVPEREKFLIMFALLSVLLLFTFIGIREKNWAKTLSSVLSLASVSFMIPYVLVYVYALAESILIWYKDSEFLIFVFVLLIFFVLSLIVISSTWVKEAISVSPPFLIQVLLLYIALSFMVLSPSIYSTSFFLLYLIFFVASNLKKRELLTKSSLVLYLLTILIFKKYELISVLVVLTIYFALNFTHELKIPKPDKRLLSFCVVTIIAFIVFGNLLGEIIPFEKSFQGVLLLFLFSSAEEVIMKGIIYKKSDRSTMAKVITSTVFTLTHLLNLGIFFTYLNIIPFYAAYLFLYQLITIFLYDRYPSIIGLSLLHFLINMGILFV